MTYTYSLTLDQAARINLDTFASQAGSTDAKELEGPIDLASHVNILVDEALENENQTDDPDEYRMRFVDAYTKAFMKTRIEQCLDEYDIAEAYHDGYTISVRDDRDEGEGYCLSFQVGQMPPHVSVQCENLDGVVAELNNSFCPQGLEWVAVEPD